MMCAYNRIPFYGQANINRTKFTWQGK